jgi:hypothetical protein
MIPLIVGFLKVYFLIFLLTFEHQSTWVSKRQINIFKKICGTFEI